MRIRLETTERDPFWIIGNPAANERASTEVAGMSSALNDAFQATRNQQAVSGAEWEAQVFYDRKNQRFAVDATTRYEFLTEWDRMDFLSRLVALEEDAQEHLWEGVAWLRLDKPGSTEYREWELPRAVVSLVGVDPVGTVALMLRYRVQAGGFSGATLNGLSELVTLTGTISRLGLRLSIAALDAACAACAAVLSADTHDFVFTLETENIGGGGFISGPWYFLPGGGSGAFGMMAYPLSTDLTRFMAEIMSTFSGLTAEVDGTDLLIVQPETAVYSSVFFSLSHRYYDTYGVLQSTLLLSGIGSAQDSTYQLTGTDADTVTYHLTSVSDS